MQEGEYQRTPEEVTALPKNYKPSGYVERANGTVDHFEYAIETFQEIYDSAIAVGRALTSVDYKARDNIGLFSTNRSEWLQVALGLYSQSMRTVSLYATLGPNTVKFIVNRAETPVTFVSLQNFGALAKTLPKTKEHVKHIVIFDDIGRYGNTLDKVTDAQREACEAHGVQCWGFSDFLAAGKTEAVQTIEPTVPVAEDLAFIMYTSGTTGDPKGVMISHRNVTSAIDSLKFHVKSDQYRYFSYLPLSHIFEFVALTYNVVRGGTIYFSQGDIRYLVQDLQEVRPEFLPGVPRVFLKFYQNIWAQVEKRSCLARWFINRAYATQCALQREGKPLDAGYDKKVFAVMREKIGIDHLRVAVTGSAPCPAYLVEFMRVLSGNNAKFFQGYGLTESCAATSANAPEDFTVGSIGIPFSDNYLRLGDVADMGYLSTNNPPTGELLICGPNVFEGYYKNEAMTQGAVVVDSKGRRWLRTGDVARYNAENGSFSIISRVKSLCKLAQGEYVSLERVEDQYGKSPLVAQVWCYGNSYKSMMVGVVVPNIVPFYEYAVQQGWWNKSVTAPVPGSITEAVAQECVRINKEHADEVRAWIVASLRQQEGEMVGFEKMKSVLVDLDVDSLGQAFNEERGTLTPTMKKRRDQLTAHYLTQLKQMYTALGEPPADDERW